MSGSPPPPSRQGATGLVRLRLIATTDLHMHVLPWDYPTGRPFGGRGLATLARLVAAARDEVPNALLFDNGDFLQGSALGDHHARDAADGPRSNPMIAAMNLLGYDAATLGNHEFSHGLPLLRAALAEARFPVVASNLHPTAPQSLFTDGPALPRVVPHLVLQRDLVDEAGIKRPLRIGLLGFLPPQTGIWERGNLDGWHIDDILPAARQGVADLRGLGADLIVALSHSGIEPGPASPGLENASAQLAALEGIDAVIAGHAHLAFPSRSVPPAPEIDPLAGTLHGKPAVMAGAFGSHLGVIDLLLEQDAADQWSVIAHRTALRANSAEAEEADPAICGAVQADHQATLDWLARPVGRTDRRLGTHFALVAPSRALRLIAQAKARYVADRLQGTAFGHLPVLASTAPFRAGGRGGPANYSDVPPGQVNLRHVLDLYPHPNTIAALRLTGAEMADWLEHAAGLFRTIRTGRQDQPLCRPDFPSFSFDLIDGLEFSIDLSQPPRFDPKGDLSDPSARRIRDLAWRGKAIRPEDTFVIATNSYRASGAGGFAGAEPANVVLADPVPVRDILIRHIETRGAVLPPTAGLWRFAPMPGTSVIFDTSPDARHMLHELHDLSAEPLDLTDDGFLRFRLFL